MLEAEGMQCPSCGKNGLVRCTHSNDDVFQCVYCDYSHDLTKSQSSPEPQEKVEGSLVWSLIALLILGLIILAG